MKKTRFEIGFLTHYGFNPVCGVAGKKAAEEAAKEIAEEYGKTPTIRVWRMEK